jgi:hypothetical protein
MHWDAGPLWQIFEAQAIDVRTMEPYPLQGPPRLEIPTPWEVRKAAARLERQLQRVENGRYLPKLPYRLNGAAVKELREAYALLDEVQETLHEARRGEGHG